MHVYHRTIHSEAILREGFRDATGTYMTGIKHTGVWVSDRPLDINEGAVGDVVLALEIPGEVFAKYEWETDSEDMPVIDDPSAPEIRIYRESLIPAEVLNKYGPPRILSEAELDELDG